jgi:hypothetical protein
MIVTYRTATEVLLTRPQIVPPGLGHQVRVTAQGGQVQQYQVSKVTWPVVIPARPQAIPDEAGVTVDVLLTPVPVKES